MRLRQGASCEVAQRDRMPASRPRGSSQPRPRILTDLEDTLVSEHDVVDGDDLSVDGHLAEAIVHRALPVYTHLRVLRRGGIRGQVKAPKGCAAQACTNKNAAAMGQRHKCRGRRTMQSSSCCLYMASWPAPSRVAQCFRSKKWLSRPSSSTNFWLLFTCGAAFNNATQATSATLE